jgi:hypothetical protein
LQKNRVAVMAVLRALIVGAVLAGCLSGPVYAQSKKGGAPPASPEEIQRKKDAEAIDKQYKATLERTRKETPTETRAADPWSYMRGADDAKTKR